MQEPTIICPNCSTEIKLTESLAGPLLEATKLKYEGKLKEQEEGFHEREQTLRVQEAELQKAKDDLEHQLEERLKKQRATIAEEEKKKAKDAIGLELQTKSDEIKNLKDYLEASSVSSDPDPNTRS